MTNQIGLHANPYFSLHAKRLGSFFHFTVCTGGVEFFRDGGRKGRREEKMDIQPLEWWII